MTRRYKDNLVEDLLGDFEYEVQVPYLLYRNANQEVNGIWFYNSHDCEAVASLFSRILNAFSKVPPKAKVSPKSEFEDLEAVPTSSVFEGPLEPANATAPIPDVPGDSFTSFFNNAINIRNAVVAAQPPLASATIPATSHASNAIPSTLHTVQSTPTLPTPSPLMPPLDTLESGTGNNNRATNLVKPSFFSPALSTASVKPPVTSMTSSSPFNSSATMQRPYGTPLLQPPPPTPFASLTPAPNYTAIIARDKVRDALLKLVQNNDFIDMIYREMQNAHYS